MKSEGDTPYCPQISTIGLWASELFPACQSPAFESIPYTLCGGLRCPPPCATRVQSIGGDDGDDHGGFSVVSTEHRYDSQQRWVGMKARELETTCLYDAAGHLSTCNGGANIKRDRGGRPTTIEYGGLTADVLYDDAGRVTRIGTYKLGYDHHRRLDKVGAVKLTWEGGRVTQEREDDTTRTFGYDAANRVVLVTSIDDPSRIDPTPTPLRIELAYDGQRLATVKRFANDHLTQVKMFDYDCNP